jgi:hypothetical protein
MAKQGDGSGGMSTTTALHKGLKTRSVQPVDASMKLGKASVNEGATRKETAPTPKTLGDRCA